MLLPAQIPKELPNFLLHKVHRCLMRCQRYISEVSLQPLNYRSHALASTTHLCAHMLRGCGLLQKQPISASLPQ